MDWFWDGVETMTRPRFWRGFFLRGCINLRGLTIFHFGIRLGTIETTRISITVTFGFLNNVS